MGLEFMVKGGCNYIKRGVHRIRVMARAGVRCALVVTIILLLLTLLLVLLVRHLQCFTSIQFSVKCFQH